MVHGFHLDLARDEIEAVAKIGWQPRGGVTKSLVEVDLCAHRHQVARIVGEVAAALVVGDAASASACTFVGGFKELHDRLPATVGACVGDEAPDAASGWTMQRTTAGTLIWRPDSGETFFKTLGIDLSAARGSRRAFCRPCVDWSERRFHLAGAVGSGIAQRLMDLRWIMRKRDGRALTVTPVGWSNIERTFGCSLHDHEPRPALRLVAG